MPIRVGIATITAIAVLTAPATIAAGTEELIVTGTRLAAEERVLPSTGTVIEREEIEARNDAVVIDLLRDVPGLHVNQPGSGGVSQVFIRGSEPNFTVFLLDGIKVNDPNNTRGGSFDLATLNLADIERVEIVRGPQSSIYGSDGLAGVINFISPRGGETLSARAGARLFQRRPTSRQVAMTSSGARFKSVVLREAAATSPSRPPAATTARPFPAAPTTQTRCPVGCTWNRLRT